MGLFEKIKAGFEKTKDGIKNNIDNVIKSFKKIDDDFWDELEETLIMSDIGVSATLDIIDNIKKEAKENHIVDTEEVSKLLQEELTKLMTNDKTIEEKFPKIILVMGVNGVGKTTTIGKLAHNYKEEGKKVIMAAADTFRAAAIEQLEVWANRVDVPIVKHNEGADPGAVIFDAIASGKAFDKFVEQNIYKLLGNNQIRPAIKGINIKSALQNTKFIPWLIYLGFFNLENLPLTRQEKRILEWAEKLKTENSTNNTPKESILLHKLFEEAK